MPQDLHAALHPCMNLASRTVAANLLQHMGTLHDRLGQQTCLLLVLPHALGSSMLTKTKVLRVGHALATSVAVWWAQVGAAELWLPWRRWQEVPCERARGRLWAHVLDGGRGRRGRAPGPPGDLLHVRRPFPPCLCQPSHSGAYLEIQGPHSVACPVIQGSAP